MLPVLSKVFEKLFLKGRTPILNEKDCILDYQFGFRQNHATAEQINRITNKINEDLEEKIHCSKAFLDISQAIVKVWYLELKLTTLHISLSKSPS